MKRNWFLIGLLLALSLTACSTGATEETTASAPEVPLSTELLVGTWKLDGTAEALTPQQAAELLPLWQLFKTLSQSDTTAPAELEAVVRQIEGLMTADQLAAIEAMDIQATSMRELMTEMGVSSGQGGAEGMTPPEGVVPGQGRGPGGGGGGDLTPEQIATAEALRAERTGASTQRVPGPLLDAFLDYLSSVAGE